MVQPESIIHSLAEFDTAAAQMSYPSWSCPFGWPDLSSVSTADSSRSISKRWAAFVFCRWSGNAFRVTISL
ncbi:MAG: hypothetical protein ACLS4Z_04050 [Christensenellaceae bacterium]